MKSRKHLQQQSVSISNISKRKLVFSILAIMFACLIFVFSARNGEESTEDSYDVGMLFGSIVYRDFDTWTEDAQLAFAAKVDHPIRKTAHATEYAVFGMLLVGALYDGKRKNRFNVLIPWGLATLYAATDEFHQLFVPGRSGQLADVMLDSVGAIAGITLLFLGIFVIHKIRNKH